ncbi:MAG: GspH/FimT family pseudopilin [Spongiibacteraceae bacterium]
MRPITPLAKKSAALRGFTFIDLLTTLSIFMVITFLGIPNFSAWLQRQAQSTVFDTLHHLSTFARTKAVKENTYLTLCASHDNVNCTGEWNKTIIIFSDPNKNETVDGDERLFKVLTLPKSTPCLLWNAGAQRQYLQFKPSGAINGTAGHFRFCDSVNNSIETRLVISFNGRTSLKSL